jgi:hypothetical protein
MPLQGILPMNSPSGAALTLRTLGATASHRASRDELAGVEPSMYLSQPQSLQIAVISVISGKPLFPHAKPWPGM